MAGVAELDAFWLPGVSADVPIEEREFGPGRLALRVPVLKPAHLSNLIDRLVDRRERVLSSRPIIEVVEAVAETCRRLTTPGEAGRDALVDLLPPLTGYSPRMIEIGLERIGRGWTVDALRSALAGELGELEVLDGFRARPAGGSQRAIGPRFIFHIFSGNIPGVSVGSLIRALCVKSASLGKSAEGEPYFAACFARRLAEVDPDLADCVAVTYWSGGDEAVESVALARAGAVIVYGSDATVESVRRRLRPGTPLIAYSNRVGAALIPKVALAGGLAELTRRAARDVATFNQQGCVSPHTFFVEAGGADSPETFAGALAGALAELSREIPRGELDPSEASAIHQIRGGAEMRDARVWASEGTTEWTVIFEERAEFELSPLNRVAYVRAVDTIDDALAALRRVSAHLQTVAVVGDDATVSELAERLVMVGATRVALVGEAGWPAPHWHHDGRYQFLDLVRWTDLEVD